MPRLLCLLALAAPLLPLRASAHLVGQRDLETLGRESTIVVRAEVLDATGEDTADDPRVLTLKVLEVLKGAAEGLLIVRGEGHHALRPPKGEQGLFFLAPSQVRPGTLASIQGEAERWRLEPVDGPAAGAIVRRLLEPAEGSRAELYLQAMAHPSRKLASHAVQRLALAAREKRLDEPDWLKLRAALYDVRIEDASRAALVNALGAQLPDGWASELARELPDSLTRAAVLQVLGRRASRGEADAERARGLLGSARLGGDPEVALAAAIGLAELGDEAALPELARALAGPLAEPRTRATLALSKLAAKGSHPARMRLLSLIDDRDPVVRLRARRALEALEVNDPLRQRRSRAGHYMAGVALVLLFGAAVVTVRSRL